MELRQLKYFVTVARTLNFSEASRRLFITQGTLSQQIRQLEDELDIHLFDRTSHSVTLTEAGESEVLFETDLSVVMRKDHPLAEKKYLSIHDLGQYKIVLPGSGLQARRIFDNYVGVDTRMLNVESGDDGILPRGLLPSESCRDSHEGEIRTDAGLCSPAQERVQEKVFGRVSEDFKGFCPD